MLEKLFEQARSDEEGTKLHDALLTYVGGFCSSFGIYNDFSKLKGIEEQLVSLGGKSAPLRFLDSAQDSEDVNGLLEDLQEAINDYMVCLPL